MRIVHQTKRKIRISQWLSWIKVTKTSISMHQSFQIQRAWTVVSKGQSMHRAWVPVKIRVSWWVAKSKKRVPARWAQSKIQLLIWVLIIKSHRKFVRRKISIASSKMMKARIKIFQQSQLWITNWALSKFLLGSMLTPLHQVEELTQFKTLSNTNFLQ